MTRLREFAIAALAAATVTAGSLAALPTASAMPKLTCDEKFERAVYYWHLGWQYYALGDFANANQYWYVSENYTRASC
jgi:hypothetical protein